MFRIIAIAFVGLVLGGCTSIPKGWECYEGKYKKATDLLAIKVGVSRGDIDKLLGKPLAIRDVSNLAPPAYKTVAVYKYYGEPPPSQRQGTGFGIPHYPTYMSVTEITREICPPAEQQDRPSLAIAYDGDDRVIIKKIPIIHAEWLYDLELGRRDLKARAFQWMDEPTMTFFGFKFIPSRRQQDYWLCLNAYNWHAWALKEMGRRHWKEDKVLGFAWYSLVSKADPADAAQQNERRKNLTSTQLSEAKKQASDLRLRMTDSPCDALPGW